VCTRLSVSPPCAVIFPLVGYLSLSHTHTHTHTLMDVSFIHRFVREHVTDRFRGTFLELEKRRLLDRQSEYDLFFLQRVFVPVVQQALDEFREVMDLVICSVALLHHDCLRGFPCD